jgi:hypothetical protein
MAVVTSVPTPKPARWIDPNAPLAKQQDIFQNLMRDPPEQSRVKRAKS